MPEPSYVQGACGAPLLGDTIGQNLMRAVERFGDRPALVDRQQGVRLTYRELWEETGRCARGLLARGVKRGDRVGIWAPNRSEWTVLQYGSARMGAILVNVNPAYKTAELEYALKQSEVSLLVLARTFRTSDYAGMLEQVRDRLPALADTLILEDGWADLLRAGDTVPDADLEAIESQLQFDDPINIQYTSGTTGFPKGATLSHHNILNNGWLVGEACRYTEEDRVCIPVPFYHCFGMVMGNLGCTTHGACMVIPGEAFEPLATLSAVQEERCTSLYGVPTMFIAELDHPDFPTFDLASLRTGIMAGSPCPVEVMKRVRSEMHMAEVTICYGMTETSPVTTQTATDDPLEKQVATVGRVHPHVEIKIVDPLSGNIVPRGEVGEFCSRGYAIMLRYWNNPQATAAAIDAARWMHTGDLATMDSEGYLAIVGRIKDMVIRGGENVYPREIEEFLYGHPDVSDVQVIGVPSERYGEETMAWVKLRPGASLTGKELAAYCQGRIATFKIPRYWKFVDGFPMTVTGKVQKFKMREEATAELGFG
ncbi:MAG: AMP-binding protein [Candidatus Dormibacteraceae bacterium]